MVFRNDRGAVFMKPYREGVSVENGHVGPSLIEEHPTTAHFRNRTLTRPRKCDGPRQPDREPNRDELDWLLPCRVSVPLPVLPPEGAGEIAAKWDVDLVALPAVSEVDARLEHGAAGIPMFLMQRLSSSGSKGADRVCNGGRRPVQGPNNRPAIFQLYWRDQDAVRGERPRKEGDQHAGNSEFACERPRVHRTGASEGQEGKVPRVESTPGQDDPHRLRHGRPDDPLDSEDRLLRRQQDLVSEAGDSPRRKVQSQRQATSEQTRSEDASGQACIRDGHLVGAAPVGDRTGFRAGAARSGPQGSARRDPGHSSPP